jgi:Arc/MetJ-type ribon-helix-helix transcriptional regulator
MKTLTVRLPDGLVAQIEAESRARRLSKSDVVRERLTRRAPNDRVRSSTFDAIADLVGSVDMPISNVSAIKKRYLKEAGYGRKRSR